MADKVQNPQLSAQIPATNTQLLSSLRVPTHYVNQFTVAITSNIVKIIFSERMTNDPDGAEPRCAVAMDRETVAAFQNAIGNLVKVVKE